MNNSSLAVIICLVGGILPMISQYCHLGTWEILSGSCSKNMSKINNYCIVLYKRSLHGDRRPDRASGSRGKNVDHFVGTLHTNLGAGCQKELLMHLFKQECLFSTIWYYSLY